MKNLTLGFVGKNSVTFRIPSLDMIGVRGTLNDDSSFIIEVSKLSFEEVNGFFEVLKEKTNNRNRKIYIILIYAILLCMSAILSIKLPSRAFPIVFAWVIVDIIGKFEFAKLIIMMIESYINPDIKAMKSLHAATHMVYNAYNVLNRVPTLEEAKQFSKYTKECSCVRGYGSFFTVGLTGLIASLVPTVSGVLLNSIFTVIYFVIIILALFVSKKVVQKGWHKYICFFTLRNPKDQELEFVIKVLEEVEKIEENPKEILKEYNIEFSEELKEIFEIIILLKTAYDTIINP